jgi:predicted transcriptional regulator
MGDQVVVERGLYDTSQECAIVGEQRMKEITQNPKFGQGYFAGCLETMVVEAKR